ncbi:hypothetical protein P3S68_014694 [Capsicum galapagoense]
MLLTAPHLHRPYALCRIKKHIRGKKVDDDDAVTCNMEEDDPMETIQVCCLNLMLHVTAKEILEAMIYGKR